MSVGSLVNDPRFQGLSPDAQKKTILAIDPRIGQLDEQHYSDFISHLQQSNGSIGANAVSDIKNIGTGLNAVAGKVLGFPQEILDSLTSPKGVETPIGQDAQAANQALYAAAPKYENGKFDSGSIANAVYDRAGQLITHPIRSFQEHPVNTALDILPFAAKPIAALGRGAIGMIDEGISPMLRSPSTVESGLGNAAKALGQEGLNSEQIGNKVGDIYNQRLGNQLENLTTPSVTPQEKYIPKSGSDILTPEFQKTASQFSPGPVTSTKVGETVSAAYKSKIGDLLANEKEAWNGLSDKHFDKPAPLENTKNYIESLYKQRGINQEPSFLDRLNPNLKEAAMKSPNPEEYAKSIYNYSEGSKYQAAYLGAQDAGAPAAEVPQISGNQSSVNKLFEAANNPDITFGQVKSLRSQLGDKIDWVGRGNENNYIMKQLYKNLSQDMVDSAKTGGFSDEVSKANQATKNFFGYIEKPSSQIINKAKYPEDLPSRLIKTDSPGRVNELFSEHNLSDADKNVVRRGVLDSWYQKSGQDPKKMARIIDSYSPETKQAIFGDKTDLVDSIKNTAATMDEELAKAKIKSPKYAVPGRSDILSKDGQTLDRIMQKSSGSELVSNMLSDGTPEAARMAKSVVGDNGMDLLRRGAINKMLENSTTKLTGRVDGRLLAGQFGKLDDQFIKEFFGSDAPTVQAIKDGSQYYAEQINKYSRSPHVPFGLRWIVDVKNLGARYRIGPKMASLLKESAGSEMSRKIVPNARAPFTQ